MHYSSRSYTAAFVFVFFFGLVGAHRFYVGRPFTGVLWALTLGLFGVGYVVDLYAITTGQFADGDGNVIVG